MTPTGLRKRAAAATTEPAVRLLAIGAVLGTALIAVLVALLGHRQDSSAHLLVEPLVVTATLSTSAALFGDPLEAEVDVNSNDRSIESGSVSIATDFRPYRVTATGISRSSQGGLSLVRTRFSLECLTRNCLPPAGGVGTVAFPPATVSYRESGRNTRTRTLVRWEPLQLSSRTPRTTTARVGMVESAPTLRSGFERSPEVLSALFLVVAAALGLAGAALVVTALWPSSLLFRGRQRPLSPLERSLQRVEAAAQSDEPTRRRTLDDLATHLGDVPAPSLESHTRAIAWGERAPDPEALTLLAAQVRTALNGGVRA